eukprot:1798798-Amphidinium_carterae.1
MVDNLQLHVFSDQTPHMQVRSVQVVVRGAHSHAVQPSRLTGGLKQFDRAVSKVCSPSELKDIEQLGSVYGEGICTMDCFGPVCANPFVPNGGEPADILRKHYPKLNFEFAAHY